jgi:hypothetical protein
MIPLSLKAAFMVAGDLIRFLKPWLSLKEGLGHSSSVFPHSDIIPGSRSLPLTGFGADSHNGVSVIIGFALTHISFVKSLVITTVLPPRLMCAAQRGAFPAQQGYHWVVFGLVIVKSPCVVSYPLLSYYDNVHNTRFIF